MADELNQTYDASKQQSQQAEELPELELEEIQGGANGAARFREFSITKTTD